MRENKLYLVSKDGIPLYIVSYQVEQSLVSVYDLHAEYPGIGRYTPASTIREVKTDADCEKILMSLCNKNFENKQGVVQFSNFQQIRKMDACFAIQLIEEKVPDTKLRKEKEKVADTKSIEEKVLDIKSIKKKAPGGGGIDIASVISTIYLYQYRKPTAKDNTDINSYLELTPYEFERQPITTKSKEGIGLASSVGGAILAGVGICLTVLAAFLSAPVLLTALGLSILFFLAGIAVTLGFKKLYKAHKNCTEISANTKPQPPDRKKM